SNLTTSVFEGLSKVVVSMLLSRAGVDTRRRFAAGDLRDVRRTMGVNPVASSSWSGSFREDVDGPGSEKRTRRFLCRRGVMASGKGRTSIEASGWGLELVAVVRRVRRRAMGMSSAIVNRNERV